MPDISSPTASTLPRGRLAGIALVSAAVLLLQLVQTRIFSVMLWYHLTYLVVTFTMLGFAAGGALLACRPKWMESGTSRRLALWSAAFALSIAAAYVIVTRQAAAASVDQHTSEGIVGAALQYAVLVIPSLMAGLVVALTLGDARGQVGRLYAVNMVGSALGCVIYIPALRQLGGEGTVLLSAALALLGAVAFARGRVDEGAPAGAMPAGLGLLALGALALALLAPRALFEVPMAPFKTMSAKLRSDPNMQVELTRWDPVCRLDVVGDRTDPNANKWVYQDGDAITILPMGPVHERTDISDKEGMGYLKFLDASNRPLKAPKVLAIGIGGGIDILQATATGRPLPPGEHVDFTGVELNHTTAGLMQNEYRDATADRYHLPNVDIHIDEGRSWLRRTDERFDIIQMTGTDTYAALASGSYVMAESYLYTAEAYDDFLAHLTDDGVISVLRFRFDPPRECLRLAAIAVEALQRAGVERPGEHIIVTAIAGPEFDDDGNRLQLGFGHLLVSKAPLTAVEVSRYQAYCGVPAFRAHLLYAPGVACEGPTADYFAAVAAGTDQAFRESYPYNLDPVDDDNPFFFRFHRWRDLWREWFGSEQRVSADLYTDLVGAKPIGLMILGTVLLESAVLVALLVLLPLLIFRREGLKVPGALRWILYFSGLGAGYMLVEIVAMQRFVLYLGHPGYAMTVVLITFLSFSGLGAHVAGRSSDPSRTLRRALLAVLLLLVVAASGIPFFFDLTLRLPWTARAVLTVVALGPLAFFMGMPFPSGLAIMARSAGQLVPWACGVNGGASVLASVGAILIALGAGFSTAFVVAGLMYLLAWLSGRRALA